MRIFLSIRKNNNNNGIINFVLISTERCGTHTQLVKNNGKLANSTNTEHQALHIK